MSSSDNIKKISIQNAAGSYDTRDVAMEAQNADVSFTGGGQVIEDITEPGVVIGSVKSLAKTVKDINTDLSNKANVSDLSGKADLDSETGLVDTDQLPDDIDDIIEGYYKESDGKFYKNYNPSTQTYSNEITGQTGKIYVDKLTNGMFRWAGSPLNQFVKIVNLGDMDLDDISNVDISTVQDGESLVYDSVRGKWVNKMQTAHFIPVPTVNIGTYTYNGSPHGPSVTGKSADFDTYVTTTGATAIDAGSYTLRFSLKNTGVDMWSDLTTADKTYNYTINKANGSVVLASNAVTLDDDHKVVSVNVTSTTGNVSASSSATGIATVTATNSAVTITATEETGTAIITVTAAASTNYKSATASIAVTASFKVLVSWSTGTDEEIVAMLEAHYNGEIDITDYWHVGDERVVHLKTIGTDYMEESHPAQDVTLVLVDANNSNYTLVSDNTKHPAFIVQQKDAGLSTSELGKMSKSSTSTSITWASCNRRTWCNNSYKGAIPSTLIGIFKEVNVPYLTSGGTMQTTNNYFFLPASQEVIGDEDVDPEDSLSQWEYYETKANRIKKVASYGEIAWWTRSRIYNASSAYFCAINSGGTIGGASATSKQGIAPAGCI